MLSGFRTKSTVHRRGEHCAPARNGGKSRFRVPALLLAAALCFFAAQASAFSVSEFSPQGQIEAASEINVVFSSAAVKSDDTGKEIRAEELPIRINPPLPGRGKWTNGLTFTYQIYSGYPMEATEYTVEVDEKLKSLSGEKLSGEREFRLNTPPLSFRGIRQVDFNSREGFVDYELSFSLPVNPFKLNGYIKVLQENGAPLEHTFLSASSGTTQRLRVDAGDGSVITLSIAKGLPSTRGPLGLTEDVTAKAERDLSLKIVNSYIRSEYDGSYIYIETSTGVDPQKARSFIKVEPPVSYTLERSGSGLRLRGDFKPRDRVLVKVFRGMASYDGFELDDEWERAFIVPDVEPSLIFTTRGRFVSSMNESLMLPLSSVNVRELEVSVRRVYDNNVTYVMRESWPYYTGNLAEEIFKKIYDLPGAPNEKREDSIDLKALVGEGKGVFEVYAGKPGSWPRVTRIVNVTDIAATAKLFDKGILVWTNSIASAKPIADVEVGVYSAGNQLLASGRTDKRGVFHYSANAKWDSAQTPDLVVTKKDGDISVLRLENNIWNRGAREYAGEAYPSGAYQGMCFTPRGVFRPGESVPLFGLVRDEKLSLPESFPVLFTVRTPLGRVWSSESIQLTDMGMLSRDIKLSDAAPTGVWEAGIYIPGEDSAIARANFMVEDFAPPRIDVVLSCDKARIVGFENATLNIAAKYTFGNVASGLPYEVEATFIPREYSHPDWRGYVFQDERAVYSTEPKVIASANLSEGGEVSLTIPNQPPASPALSALHVRAGVMEESGRWVYKSIETPYYPSSTLLGILMPDGGIVSNTQSRIGFAAIDPDGSPLDIKSARATFYKKQTRALLSEEGGSTRTELQTEYISLGNFENVSLDFTEGKAFLSLEFPSGGEYFIEAADSQGSAVASLSFFVRDARWGYQTTDATLPDSLKITLDKPIYKIGDAAEVNVSGNFAGSLMLTVESDVVLKTEVVAAGSGGVKLSLPITKEMAPNAWVTAHLVRPVSPDESWTAHRAFGAVPIAVDCSNLKLDISLASPERLLPSKKHDFTVEILDAFGKPAEAEVAAMLVDDAVLGLTRFTSPNYYEHYTKTRGLSISAFDVYRDLLRLLPIYPAPLAPGGGMADAEMAMRNAELSPVRADRFKILTETTLFKTGKDGRAEFSIDIPEFDGRARLMLFAVSKNSFGGDEKKFEIADDVVVSISLPRVLAPNDTFDSNISLFNRSKKPLEFELDISFDKILRPDDATAFPYRSVLPVAELPLTLPLKFKAADYSGAAHLSLALKSQGIDMVRSFELPVRPPYPRVTKSGSYIIEGNATRKIAFSDDWYPGTREASIFVSPMPQIALADLTKFLTEYPYYCLEQTVSGGFALISLPELAARLDPLLATPEQLKIQLEKRLARIQSLQMYDGSFSSWPNSRSSHWAGAYATHFMVACNERSIQVPGDTYASAIAFMQNFLASQPSETDVELYKAQLAMRSYITYILAMAGEPPLSWMSYLRDRIAEMPDYGRTLLAAAYARAGEKGIAREMLSISAPLDLGAHAHTREMLNLDSPIRTLALRLMAWTEIDPLSPEAANQAIALLDAIGKLESTTTQEAGFSLLALSTFFAFQDEPGEFSVSVLNNARGSTDTISADKNYKIDVTSSDTSFAITNHSPSRAYVSWISAGVPLSEPESVDNGISAKIDYYDSKGAFVGKDSVVRRGEKVSGRITLDPLSGSCSNVVVVLPIPGGLEIENANVTDFQGFDEHAYRSYSTFRHEIRDDRLLLFVDDLSEKFVWTFDARAVTAGRFAVPPIAAEGMYSPGIRSVGSSSTLSITQQ